MAQKKTERLLNLVLCLLSTQRFLSVQEIREKVPGYDEGNEEAFRRMFERDKAELREIGVPLETGSNSGRDDELGYRIASRDYQLPEIELTTDEAAAVALAARLWDSAPLAGATGSALLKLRAGGTQLGEGPPGIEPRIAVTERSFDACWQAVRDGRLVRFDYRTVGRPAPEGRDVEPWGIVSWRGRWYLVGHDLGRGEARVFRLSRVVGDLSAYGEPGTVVRPEGLDLRAMVAGTAAQRQTGTAVVRVRQGSAGDLRRSATSTEADEPGWDRLEIGYADPERLADRITGYGPDALVLGPAEVREAVVQRLRRFVAGVTT